MKRTVAYLIAFLFLVVGYISAQGDVIVIIDPDKVLKDTNLGKQMTQRLEKTKNDKEAALKLKRDELIKIEDQVRNSSTVLSDNKKLELRQQYERLQLELKSMLEQSQKELQQIQRDMIVEYNNKLKPVLDKFCKEKNFTIVLPTISVIWVDPSKDVTDEFVKRVNAEIK